MIAALLSYKQTNMEAVNKENGLSKKVKAKFKGSDSLSTYKYGESYLLTVEDHEGWILVEMGTGKGKRTYKTIEEYKKDWEELEVQEQAQRIYNLSITYSDKGVPSLVHKNLGIREGDVIACLEIAKIQFITQMTGGGQKNG